MKATRRLIVLALVAAVAACLSACAGGGPQADLLQKAFSKNIHSADLTLQWQATDHGRTQSFVLKGPFVDNGRGKLPSVDFQVALSGIGRGFAGRIQTTPDDAFITYGGDTYEVGKALVAQFLTHVQQHRRGSAQSLAALGLDPQKLLKHISSKPDGRVNGVAAGHVQARLNIRGVLQLFNKIAEKSPNGPGRPMLDDAQIAKADELATDPIVDVWVAKKDTTVRRVAARIGFRDRPGASRITRTVHALVELDNVDGNQKVTAPTSGKPIIGLLEKLHRQATPQSPPQAAGSQPTQS